MQIKERYIIKKLEWDTNFFKVNSAKVILQDEIKENDIEEILNIIKENNYRFVTIQNINNNDKNNFLLKNIKKLFLADINVQFIKKNANICSGENFLDENIFVQNKMKYNQDIIDISRNAFKYSRFISDKNLENGENIYFEWTKNSFDNEEKFFVYYKEKEKTVGYLIFSIEENDLIIELLAVNSEYAGIGIGNKLIKTVEKFSINNEINNIYVGTQINNIRAQNFYNKCGFKHFTNHSIYHLWME